MKDDANKLISRAESLLDRLESVFQTKSPATDWDAWRAMEAIQASGRARLLGISNVTLEQLRELCGRAKVRPRFVQNRCYAARGWDRDVRAYCTANGAAYQGFSLLTGNRAMLALIRQIGLVNITVDGETMSATVTSNSSDNAR